MTNLKTLVLIPTAIELQIVRDTILASRDVHIEQCGFGMVASAARTAQLVYKFRPKHVLLLGIAGSLNSRLTLGEAYQFQSVACYGIGAGSGEDFRTVGEMGWKHSQEPTIVDTVHLTNAKSTQDNLLLTCSAASNNMSEARCKLGKFPLALAEDMEGFSVAVACQMAEVPLQIVRGISNVAGDRNQSNWKSAQAMQSAAELARQVGGL